MNITSKIQISTLMISLPLMVSGCGGGGEERSAETIKTEVINSIVVPVAPDPIVNAATIQGVDANSNGVRDDVERTIAESSKSQSINDATVILSAALQGDLTGSGNISQAEYEKAFCTVVLGESPVIFEQLIINTDERRMADANRKVFRETPDCE